MNAAQAPGPAAPAMAQTLRWMLRPPLGLLERHQRRHGDVFRLELFGPRYAQDAGIGPLARRTVVVFSHPDHVQEIFSRSGDELRAGEAQQFLEWFLGPRSLMVLDGAEHHEERRALLSLFTPERLARFENVLSAAAARAVSTWPTKGETDLRLLVERALEAMNLELALGADQQGIERLVEVSRRARHAFSAPILFIPLLRSNLGAWSPGGQMATIRRGLRELVLEQVQRGNGAQAASGSFLALLLELQGGDVATEPALSLLLDRMITLLGGIDNAGAAAAWVCHHLLQNPAVLIRAREEARASGGAMPSAPYLEAVCKESLRLHPPFPVVVRRVAKPVSIGGVELAPGGFVMASMYLMHRRPDLYPEPHAFRPERFLDGQLRAGSYAPFGAGVRRCLGSALATRQLRILFSEVFRRFDIQSIAPVVCKDTRRNVTVVPAKPLLVSLGRRDEPAPAKQIPGSRHSALVQTLLSLIPPLRRSGRLLRRIGDLHQVRLLMPRQPDDHTRWPVVNRGVVLVTAPALLKEIFTAAGPALAGGEARRFTEWFFGTQSLLVLDGEEHLQERRGLLSLFSPERVSRAENLMREVTERELARVPDVGRMSLAALMDEVILATSTRLTFGAVDQITAERARSCFLGGLNSWGWSGPLLLFPSLRRDLGRWSPGGRAAQVLRDVRELVAARVARIRSGAEVGDSWLGELLALEEQAHDPPDDPGVVDRRLSRLLTIQAGTGTVAVALKWVCFHLLQDPAALARAQAEARSGAEPDYLEAVCKEATRMHPSIPILVRRVKRPVQLAEYPLEPGDYVVGCISLTHRIPALYPEPERFRPERFLERSFSPYEYLPFGGGVRRCLGMAISFRQMVLVLGALLRSFDLEPLRRFRPGERSVGVMVAPRDRLEVAFRRAGDGPGSPQA